MEEKKDITPFVPQTVEVEGKFVRVCVVCKQPKPKSAFYKDKFADFDRQDKSGLSEDCRACRMKEARIKKDIHLREIGWKKPNES